jgi:hypothetical protein
VKFNLFAIIIIFAIAKNQFLYSQNLFSFSANGFYTIKNYSKFPDIHPGYYFGLSYGKQFNDEYQWSEFYNYPQIFISLYAVKPGNPELGLILGICPEISLKIKSSDKINVKFKGGIGFSYNSNPYNYTENSLNLMIGSNITAFANGKVVIEKFYSDNLRYQFSFGAIHLSNGHLKLPNNGLNSLVVGLGVTFKKNEIKQNDILIKEFNYDHKWKKFISISFGLHEFGSATKPANGPKFLVYNLSSGMLFKNSASNRHYFGFNLTQYSSFKYFMTKQEFLNNNILLNSFTFGVFWGHEFLFGNCGFYTEACLDIYKPFYRNHVRIYDSDIGLKTFIKTINSNKIGYRYTLNLNKKLKIIAGLNLKVNFGQADFVESFILLNF